MKSTNITHTLIPAALPARDILVRGGLSGMCIFASLLDQVKKETATKENPAAGKDNYCSKILVMLADDDCDDRELFAEVVSEVNSAVQVKAVEDGIELMRTLNKTNDALPAMIFLDLNMPGKSGRECLMEIKNNPRFDHIPVVIYSTSVSYKDIHETHVIGANLYISKPNSFKGLISVVKKVFSLDLEQLKLTPPMNQFVLSSEFT